MKLSAVQTGRIDQPLSTVLYGGDGVGKTTLAADAPSPIFFGAERGTAQLDVARFPQPEVWSDIFDAIGELGSSEHSYKTLVIDTLDWLEPLCWRAVCEEQGVADIDDIGYGRGFNIALDRWRKLLGWLEKLRDTRGMNILLLAHAHVKTFKNPEGDDFDRYELKLHHKTSGLIREWADDVLFAQFETFTNKDKVGRVRGISDGSRVIHSQRTAAYDAKSRNSLPDPLPLSWEAYNDAVMAGAAANPEELRGAIGELLAQLDDSELATKVRATRNAAGDDATQLAKILNRLKTVTGTNNDSKEEVTA